MRGVVLDAGRVAVRRDLPVPARPGEVLVDVRLAGVCSTDLQLRRGYMGFAGVPGHEFVGVARDGPLAGRRVVGEINAACEACPVCRAGDGRHCPRRTVLGILGRSGAFAETLSLPAANLLPVPDAVADEAAVFTEPLAAAHRIAEQLPLAAGGRALVAGDGRLGLLSAWVLHLRGLEVVVAGRHPEHRAVLPPAVAHEVGLLEAPDPPRRFDLAVEATGRAESLALLAGHVRPRGTIVLKTTAAERAALDLAPFVVDEITVVGSRCGRFAPALELLASGAIPVAAMVHGRFPLDEAAAAFAAAAAPGTLKVLLDPREG